MKVWRISNYADLSGLGGTMGPGRWHWKGTAIVYCADHPSTSLLEILVHANRATVPEVYQLIEIDVPDDLTVIDAVVPNGWEKNTLATRDIGAAFVHEREAPLLRVPSVIMPKASNLLLNPLHPDAAKVSIVNTYRYPFDSRLLR